MLVSEEAQLYHVEGNAKPVGDRVQSGALGMIAAGDGHFSDNKALSSGFLRLQL